MTISAENSFLSEKALDYARLSQFAYAEWSYVLSDGRWQWLPDSKYRKDWAEMVTKGYSFGYYTNDPATGFSATIFQKDGKNILAIRGTEGLRDSQDLVADGALAFDKVLPYAQYQSLVDYIMSSGLDSTTFDVTGHSLGGFLAQVVKATFSDHVGDVYTYNAPGIKDLHQFNYRGVDAQGNIKLDYVSLINPTQLVSFTWPPSVYAAYQTFFANQQSSAMDAGVYNISGGVWSAPIAGAGTDIGSEVFTATSSHFIQEMIYSLQLGKYFIDPHKPVTFVGSKADEIIDGLSLTGIL